MNLLPFISLVMTMWYLSAFGQRERRDTLIHRLTSQQGLDTIFVSNSGGSMMASRQVNIYVGDQREHLALSCEHYFSDFLALLPLPDVWHNPQWRPFYATIDSIFGLTDTLSGDEPDFHWLYQAYSRQTKGDSLFRRYFTVPLNWQSMPIAQPASGWYYLDETAYPRFQELLTSAFSRDTTAHSGWLRYNGHNHFLAFTSLQYDLTQNMKPADYHNVWQQGEYTLWQTAHGLVWQKDSVYAWLFTSSASLTSGPGKLRWKSIQQVNVIEGFILLHHASPVVQDNRFFLIDPQTGMVGEIRLTKKFLNADSDQFSFEVKGSELFIRREGSAKFETAGKKIDWTQLKRCLHEKR